MRGRGGYSDGGLKMTNRYVELLVSVLVMVLIAGTVGITLTSSAMSTTEVVKTNDYGIFASAGTNETLTISCEINANDSSKWDWTVNGVTIQYPVIATDYKPVLMTDSINVGIDNDGDMIIATSSNARFTGQTILSLTLEDGVLTGTSSVGGSSPHSYNLTYDWAFYASEKGDYRSFYLLANEDFDIYYTDVNDIYGSNFVFTTNKFFSFHGTNVTYNHTSIVANLDSDDVSGTVDMKVFDMARNSGGYTFVVDNNGSDYTVHPWMMIVPYKVVSDSTEYSPTIAMLIGLIPLIAILGIVFVSVYFVARRYV